MLPFYVNLFRTVQYKWIALIVHYPTIGKQMLHVYMPMFGCVYLFSKTVRCKLCVHVSLYYCHRPTHLSTIALHWTHHEMYRGLKFFDKHYIVYTKGSFKYIHLYFLMQPFVAYISMVHSLCFKRNRTFAEVACLSSYYKHVNFCNGGLLTGHKM